jgi:hypothetical protein
MNDFQLASFSYGCKLLYASEGEGWSEGGPKRAVGLSWALGRPMLQQIFYVLASYTRIWDA